jgi:hypothetical protein
MPRSILIGPPQRRGAGRIRSVPELVALPGPDGANRHTRARRRLNLSAFLTQKGDAGKCRRCRKAWAHRRASLTWLPRRLSPQGSSADLPCHGPPPPRRYVAARQASNFHRLVTCIFPFPGGRHLRSERHPNALEGGDSSRYASGSSSCRYIIVARSPWRCRLRHLRRLGSPSNHLGHL